MAGPLLVVVTGAIASGKDTVSRELGAQLESNGLRAAVIGLDELWEMLHHEQPRKRSDISHWLLARKAAALLTDEFLSSGMDAVIVNGPFFTEEERTQYLDHLKTPLEPFFVTLRVGFEESHRRAQLDPGRVASKDRSWLAERYQLTERLLAAFSESDMIVPTDGRTAADVAAEIRTELDRTSAM